MKDKSSNINIIKQICKEVKLQVSEAEIEQFSKNIEELIDLANEIQSIVTPKFSNEVLKNFSYQQLDLLNEPIESITPTFYRENVNNMIMVPKFVDKDE